MSSKELFIEYIKSRKGFDLSDSVSNYRINTGNCFIEDFWGDKYEAFINGIIVEREKIKSLQAQNQKLIKALEFYADKNNWHYGKSWSENDCAKWNNRDDKAILYHAIVDTVYQDHLDIKLNKISPETNPLKPCDVELLDDDVELLGKKYKRYCGGKLARKTLAEIKKGDK